MLKDIVRTSWAGLLKVRGLGVMLLFAATFSSAPMSSALASPVCGWDAWDNWRCVGPDSYTALAFSDSDWSWGASWGARTREQAEAIALAQCQKRARDCHVQVWGVNNCIAWAASDGDGAWGTAFNLYVDLAEASALGNCRRAGGKKCVVRAHPCADDD
jgi:uncharacterized protein DUF4189